MTNRLKDIKRPFFALAPMANITHYPFASQCVDYGADLVWSAMVHTDLVLNNWNEAQKIIDFKDIENYIIQIVGSDPKKVSNTIKNIQRKNLKPVAFDINCGCPDKNILKSGCGGSLLKDTDKILKIFEAAKESTDLPISIKTRAGYDDLTGIYKLSEKLVGVGVAMITIHPRKVTVGYAGEADWNIVKNIKEKFKNTNTLIVGSGDIRSWGQAIEMSNFTKCDGVMIGRGALGRPWIFKEIKNQQDFSRQLSLVKNLAMDLSQKSYDISGDKGIIELRKHYGWYFREVEGSKEMRTELMQVKALKDVKRILG